MNLILKLSVTVASLTFANLVNIVAALSNLDRLFGWTCPLFTVLRLLVLLAARWQVGVVGQAAEQ